MGGHEIRNVLCSQLLPRANGTANPGNSLEPADALHVHPASDPVAEGAYLFTTRLPDPLVRAAAKGILHHGETYGFGTLWESIAGVSTWQFAVAGPIYMRDTGSIGSVAIADGERFWVWQAGTGPENVYFGIYEAVDCGYHMVGGVGISTYAVIRRVADANTAAGLCSGMVAQILGVGVEHNNEWLRITTANPITPDVTAIECELLAEEAFAPTYTYALLTAAQLTTEGATSETVQEDVTVVDGEAELENGHYTLVGVPGVAAIPAGPITFELENVLLDTADPDYLTRAKVRLLDIDRQGGGVVIASGYSQPITWGLAQQQTARNISFQVNLAADYEFNPTHGLGLLVGISTNSPTPVTLMLWINSPDHGTRVKIPGLEFPVVGGTNWHPDLLGRNSPDQHPYSALEPVGLARVPLLAATLTAGGALALGASNRYLVDPAGLDLTQIETPDVAAGVSVELELVFSAAVKLQHDATPAADHSALYVHRAGSIKNPLWLKYAYSVARLLYLPSLDRWKVMSWHDTT